MQNEHQDRFNAKIQTFLEANNIDPILVKPYTDNLWINYEYNRGGQLFLSLIKNKHIFSKELMFKLLTSIVYTIYS